MQTSGLIPGFHSEEHRAAFCAARDRWLAAGGPLRCASRAKHGGPCRGWALRGHRYCSHHAANDVQRARRLLLLTRPKTPEQAMQARRRESARVQRLVWARNRWSPGATVMLGPREAVFDADLLGCGLPLDRFSPATADAARWAWLNVQVGRMTLEQWRGRVRWHLARD